MQTAFVTGPATTRRALFQFDAQVAAWRFRSLFHDRQLCFRHPETVSLADAGFQPLNYGSPVGQPFRGGLYPVGRNLTVEPKNAGIGPENHSHGCRGLDDLFGGHVSIHR